MHSLAVVSLRSPDMTVLTEVDCVVVSYNISVRVVVVDNLSSDGSVGTARERGSAVIVNDSNRGFAAAVNQGLQQGSAPWALILNPDAQMASGALGILLESSGRRCCGLCGDTREQAVTEGHSVAVRFQIFHRERLNDYLSSSHRSCDLCASKNHSTLPVNSPSCGDKSCEVAPGRLAS